MDKWINFHELHCYRPKEQEFDTWYNTIHLPDVVASPGYTAATRYQIKEFKKGRGSFLTIYEIESDDIEETIRLRFEKMKKEIAAGRSSDLPVNVWPFVLFRLLKQEHSSDAASGQGKEMWIHTFESSPVVGKEKEFDTWYDEHIKEVLSIPGYTSASRYQIHEPLEGRGTHLAIYTIETDSIDTTIAALQEYKDSGKLHSGDPRVYTPVWKSLFYKQLFHYPGGEKDG